MVFKEMHQVSRDRGTLAMMFLMPVIQLLIFGYAINNDPRHLPLAIEANDHSAFTRTVVSALRNTSYFEVEEIVNSPGEGERMIEDGSAQFVVTIPTDFSRDLVRGQRPQLLVMADATDPSATGNALSAIDRAVSSGLAHDLIGPLGGRTASQTPVELVIHRSYNPEGITSLNIVPGVLAIILSMTMVLVTSIAVTREVEQGTMENLLATPLRPFEVMVGKIVPYFIIGIVQMVVALSFAAILFHVPFNGPILLMVAATLLFIAVSLALGFTISTMAGNQLQAVYMSIFYMLPSILLSGFAFPFRGMPVWAQWLSEILPMTHFLRLIRGIMLKGWNLWLALPEMGVLVLMLLVLSTVAVRRYQDTIA
jgi:ABC-2 type transport system permease protein